MEQKIIKATETTPNIIFKPLGGYFEISGESRPENAKEFYGNVIDWLEKYFSLFFSERDLVRKQTGMTMQFKMDYFNSTSAKYLLDIFILLDGYFAKEFDIKVIWYFKKADIEMQESGQMLSKYVQFPFHITEITDDLLIEDTEQTPSITIFPKDNIYEISGTSYPEEGIFFYQPVLEWIHTNGTERIRVDQNGNVGIGTTSPLTKLHIYDGNLVCESDSSLQASVLEHGGLQLFSSPSGSYPTVNGHIVFVDDFANDTDFRIFYNYSIGTNGALVFFSTTDGTPVTGAYRMLILNSNGYVRIGSSAAPAYQLHLTLNSAAKPVSSAWTVPSDSRLKKEVKPFTDGLNIVEKINPVWFTYNQKAGMPENDKGVGTIAQELQNIAPYMINTWQYTDTITKETTEYLGVDYWAMDFVLINSIKYLYAEVQRTKEEQHQIIAILKAENASQKTEIGSMKQRLGSHQQENAEIKTKLEKIERYLEMEIRNDRSLNYTNVGSKWPITK